MKCEMTAEQIDELIRIKTEEKFQCIEDLKWSRTDVRRENLQARLKELSADLARLRNMRSQVMESAA